MKQLRGMLFLVAMLASVSPWMGASPTPESAQEKMAKARQDEQKGDLARLHRDYEAATGYYTSALRTDRQSVVLYNKLGIAEIKLNQLKSAHKNLNQALKIAPLSYLTLNNLGAVCYLEKKYKPSVNYYKQALALNEESASIHLNLAESWMALGEMEHAMTEYSRALELDADIIANSQDGVQARVTTPEQRARVDYLIAKLYAQRGNLDGALDYLHRAKDGHFPELNRVYKDKEFAALWKDPRLAKIVKP